MPKFDVQKAVLNANGFPSFNTVQKLAVKNEKFEKNLVISAPTASGKTVIAELAIIHSVMNNKKKAIFTCPLRALASEHFEELKKKYSSLGVKMAVSTGDFDSSSNYLSKYDVIFCTNEKCLPFDEYIAYVEENNLKITKIGDFFEQLSKNAKIIKLKDKSIVIPEKKYFSVSFDFKNNALLFSEIEAVTKSKNDKKIIELKLDSGRTVDMTEDHAVFHLTNNKLQKISSMNSIGQHIAALSNSSKLFKTSLYSLNLPELFIKENLDNLICVKFTKADFSELASALTTPNRTKRRARELAKYYISTKVMPLQIAKQLKGIKIMKICSQRSDSYHYLNANLKLSKDFGKILGYFISEGCYLTPIKTHGYRVLRYPIFNKWIEKDLKKSLINEKVPFSVYSKNFQLSVKSIPYYYLFKLFGIGNAGSKKLPDFAFFAPKYFVRGLLQGLFNGDGGVNPNSIGYYTKNKELAYQIALLLTRFNVQAYIYSQKVKGYKDTYWRLGVFGGKNIKRFLQLVKQLRPNLLKKAKQRALLKERRDTMFNNLPVRQMFQKSDLHSVKKLDRAIYLAWYNNHRSSKELVEKYSKEYSYKQQENLCKAPIGFLKVKKTTKSKNHQFVYNIKTKAGNYFTANGVLVKNCDSLLRHKADWLNSVGLLIADEIHEIDSSRGPTLEMVIAKMRSINSKITILGLSATIPNSLSIAKWLNAELVKSDYRPVMLNEGVAFEGKITFQDNSTIDYVEGTSVPASLAENTLKLNKQALFFINNRKHTESMANRLSKYTDKILSLEEKKILAKKAKEIISTLESPTSQCKKLAEVVEKGSAFHHAGLLGKQRVIVEELFRERKVKMLAATTTLAAGLNLPSFRVIIPSVYRFTGNGMQPIPVREYKQWVGRAGRPKYDKEGQGILIARNENEAEELHDRFILGEVENVSSQLGLEPVLRMHSLALFAGGFAHTFEDLENFFKKTFFSTQFSVEDISEKLQKIVCELEELKFMEVDGSLLLPTPLGRRVSELYLDPISADSIIKAVSKKPNTFGMLFMLVGTYEFFPVPNVPRKLESDIWKLMLSRKEDIPIDIDKAQFEDFRLLDKFLAALILEEWINETKEQSLLEEYNVQPGFLFSKVQILNWLVYSSIELARLSGNKDTIPSLVRLSRRLKYGVKEELLELVEFKGIGRVRARKLFKAGVKTVNDVKKIDEKDLAKIIGIANAKNIKSQVDMFKLKKSAKV